MGDFGELILEVVTERRYQDLMGQRFGRLSVYEYLGGDGKHTYWGCRCDCGGFSRVTANKLKKGHTQSCGCLQRDMVREAVTTHGHNRDGKRSPEYESYCKIKGRCLTKTDHAYANYGGRGIRVCDRWVNGEGGLTGFECFLADMGERPSPKHTIDRWPDNDGHYEPGNCRWATVSQQARNRRSNRVLEINGERMTLADAAERFCIPYSVLSKRINVHGWSVDRAISQPVRAW